MGILSPNLFSHPAADNDHVAEAEAALRRAVDGHLDHWTPLVDELLPQLIASGPGVLAVIHYGSCLTRTAAADSEPDFFLVVESLARYFEGRPLDRLAGALLPPSIYHPRLVAGGRSIRCKVCVVTEGQLVRETSPAARDLYHLGRFSKRVGLCWARDAAARALVVEARAASVRAMAALAVATLGPRFTVEECARALFALSYAAERRPPEPGKVDGILAADRDHALTTTRLALASLAPTVATPLDGDAAASVWLAGPAAAALSSALEDAIARSRRRSLARWPKHLVTFDGWLDYALAKLERHTGRRLALSDKQRRHPLVYAWPQLLHLRREQLLT